MDEIKSLNKIEKKYTEKSELINKILEDPEFISCIKELIELEKDRIFCIHGLEHLFNVARIMQLINVEENLNLDRDEIYASALLHDLGRVEQYKNGRDHSIVSPEIAERILSRVGFADESIENICDAIRGHNNVEINILGKLLKFADKRSRNCYLCPASSQCKWSDEKKNRGILL